MPPAPNIDTLREIMGAPVFSALQELCFPGDGSSYRAPTCVADLRSDSVIQDRLGAPVYGEQLVTGPAWRPVVGIAENGPPQSWQSSVGLDGLFLLGAALNLLPGDPGGAIHDWPPQSDLIVTESSQRNVRGVAPYDSRVTAGKWFGGVAHMSLPGGIVGETFSDSIAQYVLRSLSRPMHQTTDGNDVDFWLIPQLLGR